MGYRVRGLLGVKGSGPGIDEREKQTHGRLSTTLLINQALRPYILDVRGFRFRVKGSGPGIYERDKQTQRTRRASTTLTPALGSYILDPKIITYNNKLSSTNIHMRNDLE